MGGQDSNPDESSNAYASVGRGGVGNLQYAKKFEGMTSEPPPPRVTPVVNPLNFFTRN
jgi:hypothetical protein